MCYLLWEKSHRFFSNRKTHALVFLARQMCAMLAGIGREGLYGGPWMGWGEEK